MTSETVRNEPATAATVGRNETLVAPRRDRLVPVGSAGHVTDVLPSPQHLVLDCGHVPQLERPAETHDAIGRFLAESGLDRLH